MLSDAAAAARQLSVSLDALQRRIRDPRPRRTRRGRRVAAPLRAGPDGRAQPRLPGGLVAETSAGVEAMLATSGVVLVVDGYNVANRAWSDYDRRRPAERLGVAATALCRRSGCEIVLVFDGDGSGRPALRRRWRTRLFSDAGQEADEVVSAKSSPAPPHPRRGRRRRTRG